MKDFAGVLIAHHTHFDPERHTLGSLCKRGHDFQNQGLSARYRSANGGCVACLVEIAAAERAAATERRLHQRALPPGMKRCPDCKIVQPHGAFFRNRNVKDGCSAYCKACQSARSNQSREKTRLQQLVKARARHKLDWIDNLWRGSRGSAKARGLNHTITREDLTALWEQQAGKCFWLGVPMGGAALPNRHPSKVSLERLRNDEGYVRGNVVLACAFANMGRSDTPAAEFSSFLWELADVAYDTKLAQAFAKRSKEQP